MAIPLWLQSKYVALLAVRLERFKKTAEHTWNFRCPLCGDSQTKKSKARGYIYHKKGDLNYQCKNCGVGTTFSHFLKDMDPRLHGEMTLEAMRENTPGFEQAIVNRVEPIKPPNWQQGLHRISKLPSSHVARAYVERRQLPEEHWGLLFHADGFAAWANSLIPGKFSTNRDEPRLVIPFLDADGEPTGFQGRSYQPSTVPRYMSMSLMRGPMVFGAERMRSGRLILVTEGPFDSLFLDNGISTAGGDLSSTIAKSPYPHESFVIIYDNERRSPHTVQKMAKALQRGYRVCIWPDHVLEKDINDMRVCGLKPEAINQIILENNYEGMLGELMLSKWRRD